MTNRFILAGTVLARVALIDAPAPAEEAATPTDTSLLALESPPCFLGEWGSEGSGQGEFLSPHGIALDSAGNVYVTDSRNSRVQKFTPAGGFLTSWGAYGSGDEEFIRPVDVGVDAAGYVYVVDDGYLTGGQQSMSVRKFTSDGVFETRWGTFGSADGQFNMPNGVAVNSQGEIYVAERRNPRVQKFTSQGEFLLKWGSGGTGEGQFGWAAGIAVDPDGNVYVTDRINDRIQKFSSSGEFLRMWGTTGSAAGQFRVPVGVATDHEGRVYVADTQNHRIQKFTSDGTFLAEWGTFAGPDVRGGTYH